MREPTILSHDKLSTWFGHPKTQNKAAYCKVQIIAGFWRTLPNFVDHELAFFRGDPHLEALANQVSFGYLR